MSCPEKPMPKSVLKPVFVDLPVLPQQAPRPCRSALVNDAKNLSDFDQFPTRANHLLLAVLLCQNPFYEGVGFMSKYNESERDTACIWSQEGRTLTIQTISGQGTCLGKVPLSHQHICNQNTPMVHSKWVISPEQAWWACSTGLTLCVHGEFLIPLLQRSSLF